MCAHSAKLIFTPAYYSNNFTDVRYTTGNEVVYAYIYVFSAVTIHTFEH